MEKYVCVLGGALLSFAILANLKLVVVYFVVVFWKFCGDFLVLFVKGNISICSLFFSKFGCQDHLEATRREFTEKQRLELENFTGWRRLGAGGGAGGAGGGAEGAGGGAGAGGGGAGAGGGAVAGAG